MITLLTYSVALVSIISFLTIVILISIGEEDLAEKLGFLYVISTMILPILNIILFTGGSR